MRNLIFIGLGIGFVLFGAALLALTFRKPEKSAPAVPNKSQLREAAALAEENRKMKIAAGCVAGFGALLIVLSFL